MDYSTLTQAEIEIVLAANHDVRFHVIGRTEVSVRFLKEVLLKRGIPERRVTFNNAPENFKKLNPMLYTKNHDLVLVGPIPHKTYNVGGSSSFIEALKYHDVPVFEMKEQSQAGRLKISKHSFETALDLAIHHILLRQPVIIL